MDDLDRQMLKNNPRWQQVLEAYLEMAAEPVLRPEEQTGPRWSGRLIAVDDIDPAELSTIHGQLIALGWLAFQLETGETGLTYRVSSDGRALLKSLGREAESSEDQERDDLAA